MPDISITPANLFPSNAGNPIRGTATAAITAGDVVCVLADGTIDRADANLGAPYNLPAGIAVCSAPGPGQPVLYVSQDPNFTIGGTVVQGKPYFLSGNAGKICDSTDLVSGMATSLIGFGKGTNQLVVNVIASGQVI